MGIEPVKWLVVVALCGACYNPAQDGHCTVQCATSGEACPGGMTCGPDLLCYDNDRGECKHDGGLDTGCWPFWKAPSGPKLEPPERVLHDTIEPLTNPSLTQDGLHMYVSVAAAPNQRIHHSFFNGDTWSTPTLVSAANNGIVRIRCTFPASRATAICVDNMNGPTDLTLIEWMVTDYDEFGTSSTTSVSALNSATGAQGDPDLNRDGTQLFYLSDKMITRATRQGAAFTAPIVLGGFTSDDRSPSISPNADVIVFTRGPVGSGELLAYGVRQSGSEWKTMPLNVPDLRLNQDTDPELSPDGCQLFVASTRSSAVRDIYAFQITGISE